MREAILGMLFMLPFCSYAQTVDPTLITETMRAYTNAGDTVGIFMVKDGKKQLMDPIKFQGIKANALGAALTGGIAKTSAKVVFDGATSPYVFSGGEAHFRMYFGMVPTSKVASYYMFSQNYSIRNFAVSKFTVKKNRRQMVSSSYSLFGGLQTGSKADDSVNISYEQVREGVYDITVKAAPGEYCFTFNNAGAGGFSSVFDFTIK